MSKPLTNSELREKQDWYETLDDYIYWINRYSQRNQKKEREEKIWQLVEEMLAQQDAIVNAVIGEKYKKGKPALGGAFTYHRKHEHGTESVTKETALIVNREYDEQHTTYNNLRGE